MVLIPILDLELQHGTLGGVYTTIEGLLKKIHKSLVENNPFAIGDSTTLHHSNSTQVSEVNIHCFDWFMIKILELWMKYDNYEWYLRFFMSEIY